MNLPIVPSVWPLSSGLVQAGRWITLKNHERVSVVMKIGGTAGDTQTLRLRQATNVAGAGAAVLNFEAVWRTGARLYFQPATVVGTFRVGEAVVGAGAGSGVIHSIHANHFVIHSFNETVFVAGEVITGAVSGATANLAAANFYLDADILVRQELAAPASTFVAPAVVNKVYIVEICGADLAVNTGYDCIQADISAVGGAGATTKQIDYILFPKYKGEPTETAISN